jgi:hypothetical protein
MCAHDIEDFAGTDASQWVAAEHNHPLVGECFVERSFVLQKLCPVVFRQPCLVTIHSHPGIAFYQGVSELLFPAVGDPLQIENALFEIPF